MSKNSKNWWKSMKIGNIAREILHNFLTTWLISMKFSGKMYLMIILKVTKNQAFSLSLEDTFFEKPCNSWVWEAKIISILNKKYAKCVSMLLLCFPYWLWTMMVMIRVVLSSWYKKEENQRYKFKSGFNPIKSWSHTVFERKLKYFLVFFKPNWWYKFNISEIHISSKHLPVQSQPEKH